MLRHGIFFHSYFRFLTSGRFKVQNIPQSGTRPILTQFIVFIKHSTIVNANALGWSRLVKKNCTPKWSSSLSIDLSETQIRLANAKRTSVAKYKYQQVKRRFCDFLFSIEIDVEEYMQCKAFVWTLLYRSIYRCRLPIHDGKVQINTLTLSDEELCLPLSLSRSRHLTWTWTTTHQKSKTTCLRNIQHHFLPTISISE